MRELVPNADVIALPLNPDDPWAESETRDTQSAALSVGQHLTVLKAITELDIDAAYSKLVSSGPLRASSLPVHSSLRGLNS